MAYKATHCAERALTSVSQLHPWRSESVLRYEIRASGTNWMLKEEGTATAGIRRGTITMGQTRLDRVELRANRGRRPKEIIADKRFWSPKPAGVQPDDQTAFTPARLHTPASQEKQPCDPATGRRHY